MLKVNFKSRYLVLLIPIGFLGFFYFLPIYEILTRSLTDVAIFIEPKLQTRLFSVTRFTLWQALLSTLLTLGVGIPLGALFHTFHFKTRTFFYLLVAIPFMLPTVVVAAAFNSFLGPNGWVNLLWRMALPGSVGISFTYTLWAILCAHIFYNTIIVVRMTRAAWENLNPDMERAARVLGADRFTAWRTATLPNLLPAIFSAALLVFFFDFTSFGVILMLGGPKFSTLETEIYKQTINFLDLNTAGALSLIQILFSTGFSVLYAKYLSRVGSHGTKLNFRRAIEPRKWFEKLIVWVGVGFITLFYLLPLLSVPVRSLLSIAPERGTGNLKAEFTFRFFSGLFENTRDSYFFVPPMQAVLNSLSYAGMTILLSLLIALPTALLLKQKPDLKKWIEPLFILPLGTSSITLGLGYILFFNYTPALLGQNLLTSQWLLPFAHTTIALPFVTRSLLTALEQIPASYLNSASVLGANKWQQFKSITLPLLKKPLLAAMAFSFTISLGEFGAASLLSRPEYPTLPTAIYRYISQPGAANYGQSMAMATILLTLCAIGILLIEGDELKRNAR